MITNFFYFLISISAGASSPNLETKLRELPCKSEVRASLPAELRKMSWVPFTVSLAGEDVYEGVTFRDTRRDEVQTLWGDSKHVVLARESMTNESATWLTWQTAKACKSETSSQKSLRSREAEWELPEPEGFADTDLFETLRSHTWGVIYIWSPYMPLSVQGIAEIRAAVKHLKGHLTVLVDPAAKPTAIASGKKQKGVMDTDLVLAISSELKARGLGLHYPIAFVYERGFLSNRTYIGFKPAETFKKWIVKERRNIKSDLAL